MHKLILVSLALVALTTFSQASPLQFTSERECQQGVNCKLPECRCPDVFSLPGNLEKASTPQIILLTFGYSFNQHSVKDYVNLLNRLHNPNNCSAKGTFFVQKFNSELDTIKDIYEMGNEIAINSINGMIPSNETEWMDNVETVADYVKNAGIPLRKVIGMRGPDNFFGGRDQFDAIQETAMTYDSSCVMLKGSGPMWPFTLDYVSAYNKVECIQGGYLRKPYKGIWEIPVNALHYQDLVCPIPSGCIPVVNSTEDTFRMFFDNFKMHYHGNRAPFVIDVDPRWLRNESRLAGTEMFLDEVATYHDTWFLTISQALEWIKNPVAITNETNYKPWSC